MRILHVVESIGQSAGSVAICLRGLARALRGLGVESELTESIEPGGGACSRADLIHVIGWHYPSALGAAKAAKREKKPWVLSPLGALTPGPHDVPGVLTRLVRSFTEKPLRRSSKVVTAVQEYEAQLLRGMSEPQRLRVLPIGIDYEEFPPVKENPRPTPTRNILMLGPLDPAGGSVLLLKALAELGQEADGWMVTLAGSDPQNMRPKLEAAVWRKGGEARVVFADAPTLEKQREQLARASVLADLSLRVSPGVSMMQALSMGVPVVATECVAPLRADAGFTVCGPRRDDVREALRAVIGMEAGELRIKGEQAKSRSKPILDWAALAPRYLEMYEGCLRA